MSETTLAKTEKQKTNTQERGGFNGKNKQPILFSPTAEIMHLQNTFGNRAVGQVLQAKLKINQPGDKYEREADRIAEMVMRMPEPQLQNDKDNEGKPLASKITLLAQRSENNGVGSEVTPQIKDKINGLNGGGQPLPETTRHFFEKRFGANFSDVRVHTESTAASLANLIDAKAFTFGRNIVFSNGHYGTENKYGKNLLAHELTHVLQQKNTLPTTIRRQSLSNFSHQQRGNIKVVEDKRTPSKNYAQYFSGKDSITLSATVSISYDSKIPKGMHMGLKSVAADLIGSVLTLNSTTAILVDLSPLKKGKRVFRFTYVKNRIHVEGGDPLVSLQQAPLPDLKKRAKRFDIEVVSFGKTKPQEEEMVYKAISLMNDNILMLVYGLKIQYTSSNYKKDPKAPAWYDEEKHLIYIKDKIFDSSLNYYNTPKGYASESIRRITHEIGHVADLRMLVTGKKTISESGYRYVEQGRKEWSKSANTDFVKAAKPSRANDRRYTPAAVVPAVKIRCSSSVPVS